MSIEYELQTFICKKKVLVANMENIEDIYELLSGQQNISKAEAFWRQILHGFTAPTSLVVDRYAGKLSNQKESYDEQHLQLSATVTAALHSLALQHYLTLNILVQGAWALLLSRYSGESNVVFGTLISGRPPALKGVESMVELLINTLPVRVQVCEEADLLPWLQQLQAQQVEREHYSYTPLVEIQGWSEVAQGMPLFESIVVFENDPADSYLQQQNPSLKVGRINTIEQTNYPLTVAAVLGQELSISIRYNTIRFEPAAISRMLGHFQTLLEAIVVNPRRHLQELPLLTEVERHKLLVEWNNTQIEYPQDKCIHQLFEAQVEQTPDAVAVMFEDQQLTYQELNCRANQLAHHLQALGIGPGVLVGICVERSIEMIVGLLGILKAGGAYVPLDPTYPEVRLTYMLSDLQVSVLLTQQTLIPRLPKHSERVVCLDTDWGVISQEKTANPVNGLQGSHLAYVIYTSGSTGIPKGVMIQHQSLVNFTEMARVEYEIDRRDRILQFASISFDAAAEEIYPCLTSGGMLVLRTDEILRSVPEFLQKSRDLQLTVLDLPTAYWHQIVSELASANLVLPESLRLVIIGGEKALPEQVRIWHTCVGSLPRLVNTYGPTEATVVTTLCTLSRSVLANRQEVSIGVPVLNVQVYILDQYLQPVPIGVLGELYIGGAGLALGYLNRPDLTSEKFIPNPFSQEEGARLYKTNDLARYLNDGNIEFLGRLDEQVKIRGFRIEPGEIEAVLITHPKVQGTKVIAREDQPGDKRLVAYVVPYQGQSLILSELRRFLKQNLPEYMIPSAFVMLQALPMTPNGKVDSRALPTPDLSQRSLEVGYLPPHTPTEEVLVAIWNKVLGVEVGIHDNFFELGGHSLKATQVMSRVKETFRLTLPVRCLFEEPTIVKLSKAIEKAKHSGAELQEPVIKPVSRKRHSVKASPQGVLETPKTLKK
ncbi:non-ribosomal peptide synthetase [Nostoc sp.]|uniref:non-ribosomal peptide synthetase n=1 Tax=Nostoc sp. TaxID=1180 RepID=UPI002FF4D4D1